MHCRAKWIGYFYIKFFLSTLGNDTVWTKSLKHEKYLQKYRSFEKMFGYVQFSTKFCYLLKSLDDSYSGVQLKEKINKFNCPV